ncbi:hypothetical protein HPB48_007670 [Haemaphysalis longicornis]|uniref:Uncharacterized protein n=1 Tax=Haemaphysalis longicornis TaxID=44386 RepID=A0A9J6G440_HAELO|nr:hypothetical protein HPB48_007670 [Haemaphysalis longicornis]
MPTHEPTCFVVANRRGRREARILGSTSRNGRVRMFRGRALRRCGRKGLQTILRGGTGASHHMVLLELVRWHPGALSGPGEPRLVLGVALPWLCRCQDEPPLAEAAVGSLVLRHRASLRDCCFELLMSALHLLGSPTDSVRHKALGLALVLSAWHGVPCADSARSGPDVRARELLYLTATGDRLQRLATMVAFRRLLCRGHGNQGAEALPLQALYEVYKEHAEHPVDDVLRTEGSLGLEMLAHACEELARLGTGSRHAVPSHTFRDVRRGS